MAEVKRPAALLDWAVTMEVGLGLLRLAPASFWAMTPRELCAAAGLLREAAVRPQRADLVRLMAEFPDGETDG